MGVEMSPVEIMERSRERRKVEDASQVVEGGLSWLFSMGNGSMHFIQNLFAGYHMDAIYLDRSKRDVRAERGIHS